MKKQATLRYFTQFRLPVGHVRAVVRYGKTRRFITTPIAITKQMLPALNSAGYVDFGKLPRDANGAIPQEIKNRAIMLHGQLRTYTAVVWRVVMPLIEQARFKEIESRKLGDKINAAYGAPMRKRKKLIKKIPDMTEKFSAIYLLQDVYLNDQVEENEWLRGRLRELKNAAEKLNEELNALKVVRPAGCSCDPKHQTYKALNRIKSVVSSTLDVFNTKSLAKYNLITDIIERMKPADEGEDDEE